MSLKHAILVLLDREPGSGYDLTQRFRQGIGHFWRASHQQIYQQLKGLDSAGWVTHQTLPQRGKPDRKVYSITPQGHDALIEWLNEPAPAPLTRDALLVKIFAAQLADQSRLLAELDRQLERQHDILAGHRRKEAAYFDLDEAGQRQMRLPYLTLRRGIRHAEDNIEWLGETRELIATDALPRAPVPQRVK